MVMDGINISKQASVHDFVVNAAQVLASEGDVSHVTQRTFGGSVVLFGFIRRATLILDIIV
jgi:hypothetical protein